MENMREELERMAILHGDLRALSTPEGEQNEAPEGANYRQDSTVVIRSMRESVRGRRPGTWVLAWCPRTDEGPARTAYTQEGDHSPTTEEHRPGKKVSWAKIVDQDEGEAVQLKERPDNSPIGASKFSAPQEDVRSLRPRQHYPNWKGEVKRIFTSLNFQAVQSGTVIHVVQSPEGPYKIRVTYSIRTPEASKKKTPLKKLHLR